MMMRVMLRFPLLASLLWQSILPARRLFVKWREGSLLSQTDLIRWEKRYLSKDLLVHEPLPWLLSKQDWLHPGAVLDVAGGDGANALYLSRQGWPVTVIDIAPAALARLRGRAEEQGLEIGCVVHDLDEPLEGLEPGLFSNLLISRYKPGDSQWPGLLSLLAPGGRVLICSFGAARAGMNPAYRYDRGDLEALFAGRLKLLLHEELEDGLEGFIFERYFD